MIMEKIQVKLCAGTMCYIMGGAQLTEVTELLTNDEKQYVEISLAPCLGYCEKQKNPPFATVDGEFIENVNKEILLQIIKDKIRNAVR